MQFAKIANEICSKGKVSGILSDFFCFSDCDIIVKCKKHQSCMKYSIQFMPFHKNFKFRNFNVRISAIDGIKRIDVL